MHKADHSWAPEISNANDEETLGGADGEYKRMVKAYEEADEGGEEQLRRLYASLSPRLFCLRYHG